MKVIYVFERRHGYVHDFESFQMDSFVSKGYEVEVWTVVNWKFPGVDKPKNIDMSGRTHDICNKDSLKYEINRIKKEDCIFLIYPYHAYDYISYLIRKYIKNAGFDFCNITESPAIQEEFKSWNLDDKYSIYLKELYQTLRGTGKVFLKNPILKLLNKKNKSSNVNLIAEALNFYARFFGPLKYKSLYNFVTVEMLYHSFPNYFEIFSKRNILVHAMSYDEYLKTKNFPPLYLDDYVVYVDDYEIGHSDFIKMGIWFPVSNAETHFERLNRLFDKIENAWGCKVIIAAHPKAEYIGDEFGGRRIVYFKTDSLIKYAKLVIIGTSTCLGTMIMYEKDYLNIYSSEYFVNVPMMENDYKAMRQWLRCRQLDIQKKDQVEQWETYVTKYDKDIGENYKKSFVISDAGIPNKRMYDVIRDIIMET